MKIAIMMRAMDADSGFRAIIEGLVETLIEIGRHHTFLLLYQTSKRFGRFAHYQNVTEILAKAPHKLLWDQVVVPVVSWRAGVDLIYNPKFSVPLISSCPVVMGLHEPAWWAWPEHYEWLDRNYMKCMLPFYVRKARHLFPISQFVVDECRKYIQLGPDQATVIYPAPRDYFHPIDKDDESLVDFRRRMGLPKRFILCVTRVDHPGVSGSTSFFPGKNSQVVVKAFMSCRDRLDCKLVIVGSKVEEYLAYQGFSKQDLEGVILPGFVAHEDIPKLLNLAELFVLPSYYESYAMALVEAMRCGAPIVASCTGACPEITGGAALLVDPDDYVSFAQAFEEILGDAERRGKMHMQSLERARFFTWDRSIHEMLDRMEKVVVESRRN